MSLPGRALLLVLAVAGVARADIYAFQDAAGTTHFSNVPDDPRYRLVMVAADASTQAGEPLDARLLQRAARFERIIKQASRATRVAPELLRAVIVVESGFNERARSRRGARGLMQLMPETARRYGAANAYDPEQNVRAGARYLRDLIRRYADDLELVLAAYNAGEAAVDRHGGRIPPYAETQAYVPRVLGIYSRLRDLNPQG
ncbi:MAG: lytic transglycosylase domain-containing protein [Steroidobacteraceae bacterium]